MKRMLLALAALFGVAAMQAQEPAVLQQLRKKYNHVGELSDGLHLIHRGSEKAHPRLGRYRTDGQFGYADSTGKVVIEPSWNYATDFDGGFAVVGRGKGDNRKFGVIDRTGREVIPCEWDDVSLPSDNRVLLQQGLGTDRLYGFADTTGLIVIPVRYGFARPFSEGRAVVGEGAWVEKELAEEYKNSSLKYEFQGKFGFIDTRGDSVTEPVYEEAYSFRNGLAPVAKAGKYYLKWGYIDPAGAEKIPFDYYAADPFSEDGYATVSRISGGAPKWGLIDSTGRIVIPIQYDRISRFKEAVWVGTGDDPCAYMLMDLTGKPLMDRPVYDLNDSGRLGHCSAALPDENGILRYGIIDSRGRIVLPFRFDRVTIFSEWNPATSEYEERGIADLDGASYPFTLRKR